MMTDEILSANGRAYIATRLLQSVERARRNRHAADTLRFELMAAKNGEGFSPPRYLVEKSGRCRLSLTWTDADVEIKFTPEGFSRIASLANRQAELRSLSADTIKYRFRFDRMGEARIVLKRSDEVESALQDFEIDLAPEG